MNINTTTSVVTNDMREVIQALRGAVADTHSDLFKVHLQDGGSVELTGCEFHRLLDYAYAWLRTA